MATTPKLNIAQRLNAVQQEVTYVQKEKKQGMRYSIVSHDDVTAKVRPHMVKHGVLYYPVDMTMQQVGNRTEATMTVRFENIDDRQDYIDVVSAGYGIDEQDKGPGKAISYAVKYSLLKALGLESGDDPDKDQEKVFDDPNHPVRVKLSAFETGIDGVTNAKELAQLGADNAQTMAEAQSVCPAHAAPVKAKYARKLAELKKGSS